MSVDELLALDIRVGTIISAEVLRGARTPAFMMRVDFGPVGVRTASVGITDLYEHDDLVGLQVLGVVNLPSHRVAGVACDARVLAADNGRGEQVLAIPERPLPDGSKVGA